MVQQKWQTRSNNLKMKLIKKILAIGFCFITMHYLDAQVKLPQIIRDSMILQRDAKINVWGFALQNEKITIRFNNKTYKTITNDNGKWILQLPSMKTGGPYTMEISGKNGASNETASHKLCG